MHSDTLFGDRYLIKEELGNEKYLAEHNLSGEKRIIKYMAKMPSDSRLNNIRSIRHPGLPRIFEVIENKGKKYLVLESKEGKNLGELLKARNGKFPYFEACKYTGKICDILYLLHEGTETMLHLEIDLCSIYISDDESVFLSDYGLMYFVDENSDRTLRDDMKGVGDILLQLITGDMNLYDINIQKQEYYYGIPGPISKIIKKCASVNPMHSYSNIGALAADLESLCETVLDRDIYSDTEYIEPVEKMHINDKGTFKKEFFGKIFSSAKSTSNERRGSQKHIKTICVWDNARFAGEMSCVLSGLNKNVLLIDANLLSPEIDLIIELRNKRLSLNDEASGTCLSILMEENANKTLSYDSIKANSLKTGEKNLNCNCGNYRAEDYEYYSTEGLAEIIDKSKQAFDYVIISCSKFIYDEFTCISLMSADIVFIPIIANNVYFREYNRYINFMSARKQMNPDNVFFVGYDYRPGDDFSFGTCDELCDGRFIGTIGYSSKRRMMHGSDKPYTGCMESKIQKQYISLLNKTNIVN